MGWQPGFIEFIPQMTVEMFTSMPFAEDYRKLAPNPEGFPELVKKLIALEKEPMAWEKDVRALKLPVLIVGKPLPASRLAIMPATSHTAVITQTDLLHSLIEPFLKGEVAKGMFQ